MNRWLERGLWLSLSLTMTGWLIYEHFWINKMGPLSESQQGFYISPYSYQLILTGYLFAHVMFIRALFARVERLEVTPMLWRLFLVGMGGILTLLMIFFAYDGWLVGRMSSFVQGVSQAVFFTLGLEVTLVFFLSGLFTFRRFILYQKNRAKVRSWNGLIGMLVLALVFTNRWSVFSLFDSPNVHNSVRITFAIVYGVLLVYLATQVRWVGFLNLNQKLRALGLLLLVLAVGGTFVAALYNLPGTLQFHPYAQTQLATYYFEPVFLAYIAAFTFVYAVGAILVLFFNLPTSSVFEQKRSEIASFNKINQSIQANLHREEVLKTTLEASILSSNAEAGWIDQLEPDTPPVTILSAQVPDEEITALSGHYDLATRMLQSREPVVVKNTRRHKAFRASGSVFRSLLGLPVITDGKVTHAVFVVSTLSNAFEDETLGTLQAYAAQAGAAIENAARIQNAISLERYEEQLKIAKEVQKDLLPRSLPQGNGVKFAAVSETAEEVGGDYFDILPLDNERYNVAIGDVSGKGTKAAFYMAEVKGVFHALSAVGVSPVDFVRHANRAVAACFQAGNFVTLTFLQIDARNRTIHMIRAGHCPAMLYRAETGEVSMCRAGTLALGMVNPKSFEKHLETSDAFSVYPGDLLVLYTDGIIEARNEEGESFGYERLEAVVKENAPKGPHSVSQLILDQVNSFVEGQLQDDYTILSVGFDPASQPNSD